MAKSKRFILGGFFVLLLTPFLYVGSVVTIKWIALRYVSSRLDIDAASWMDAYKAFESRFELGMTRQEAIEVLLEIDPYMSKDDFVSDEELYNTFPCPRSDNRCGERVLVFRNTPLIGSAIRFDYGFVYDPEMHLIRVFGPPS